MAECQTKFYNRKDCGRDDWYGRIVKWQALSLIRNLFSHRLNLTSLSFAIQTLPLRTPSRFAGFTGFGDCDSEALLRSADRTLNQVLQTLQRLFPILLLAAVFLSFDDNDPFLGNALVRKLQQPLFVAFGQRRSHDVKMQVEWRSPNSLFLLSGNGR